MFAQGTKQARTATAACNNGPKSVLCRHNTDSSTELGAFLCLNDGLRNWTGLKMSGKSSQCPNKIFEIFQKDHLKMTRKSVS